MLPGSAPAEFCVSPIERSGTTGLKMWADKVLKNTLGNILSVGEASLKENRFTHSFSPVTPVVGGPD
jgi:hypothetical protein